MTNTMSGKGLHGTAAAPLAAPAGQPAMQMLGSPAVPVAVLPASPASAPIELEKPLQFSGCIVNVKGRCGCFDGAGQIVAVAHDVCMSHTNAGGAKPLEFTDSPVGRIVDAAEGDAMAFAFKAR